MQSQDETPTLQTSWSLYLKDQDKLKSSDRPSVQYEYDRKNQTLIIFEVCFDSIKRSEGEGDQKLTNQFSYVERATQTMNNTLKVITTLLVAMLMSIQSLLFCDCLCNCWCVSRETTKDKCAEGIVKGLTGVNRDS